MARFVAVAPLAPEGQQSAMNTETTRSSSQGDGCGEDPFALIENCDYPPPSETAEIGDHSVEHEKPADDDDDVAIPIPIATLVFQDGRTEPVYKPLAGHEHLFKARPTVASPTSFGSRIPSFYRPIQAGPAQIPGTAQRSLSETGPAARPLKQPASRRPKNPVSQKQGLLKPKSLKRSRSIAQGLAPNRKPDVSSEDLEVESRTVEIITEESRTFYIGDINALKEFLRHRFDELTMKPLRGIVTHWVKLIEPRRLGDWGKYHEMLPSEADTPPWWPKTVIYKEPSHLKKSELSTLAVEMMLVHRKIDEMKRQGAWINKLRDVAKFTIQTTSADHFSSSKGAAHSEEMKKRALDLILPSVFDVAQSYEDHIMQYSLFEGSGNVDPGRGKHHTWKSIPRPARRQPLKRPRRAVGRSSVAPQESICEASGDETEPDDTMARLATIPHGLPYIAPSPRPSTAQSQPSINTPRQSATAGDNFVQAWKLGSPVSTTSPCPPTPSQDDYKMQRTASTPNSSFDQSLHGLHLGEEELEANASARTICEKSTMPPSYNMVTYSQPVPYPAAQTSFEGQTYPSTNKYSDSGPPPFAQNGTAFINPFTMFNTPTPPVSYTQYGSPMPTPNGYMYEQGMFPSTPMSFPPTTPMSMPMTPSDPNVSFHGLPSDYPVDPRGLHHY